MKMGITLSRHPRLLLALVATIIYLPTLFFDFVYMDDYLIVQESAFYTELKSIPATFTRTFWLPSVSSYNYYRPVSTSFYVLPAWLSQNISGEVQAWTFHAMNLILIAGVAGVAFAFLKSYVAVLLLLVHPASVITVAWISGQNEMLLTIFVLAAVLTVGRWWHGLFFLLALLVKENALMLPLVAAGWMFLQKAPRKAWLISAAGWAVAFVGWRLLLSQGAAGQSMPPVSESLASMFHGLKYVLVYLGNYAWPMLAVLPNGIDTPMHVYVLGGLLALGFIGLSVWKPRAGFGFAWFLVFLLPTFANMPVEGSELFVLRGDRAFLASIGLIYAGMQLPAWRPALAVLPILLLLNVYHQFDFKNGMAFYTNAVNTTPSSSFALTHLGDMYIMEKDLPRAEELYLKAIAINPYENNAHNNLGVVYMRSGQLGKAAEAFQKELAHNPNNLLSLGNLGAIEFNRRNYAEAEKAFRRMVELNPAYQEAWQSLVGVYLQTGDRAKLEEAQRGLTNSQKQVDRGL